MNEVIVFKQCVSCGMDFLRGHRSKQQWVDAKYCSLKCIGIGRSDSNHHNWKGDDVSYIGLHYWIKRHLGIPSICENCSKEGLYGKKIHWANRSGLYKRDKTDWIRLCVPCHSNYDKSWINRKRDKNGRFC